MLISDRNLIEYFELMNVKLKIHVGFPVVHVIFSSVRFNLFY